MILLISVVSLINPSVWWGEGEVRDTDVEMWKVEEEK